MKKITVSLNLEINMREWELNSLEESIKENDICKYLGQASIDYDSIKIKKNSDDEILITHLSQTDGDIVVNKIKRSDVEKYMKTNQLTKIDVTLINGSVI